MGAQVRTRRLPMYALALPVAVALSACIARQDRPTGWEGTAVDEHTNTVYARRH